MQGYEIIILNFIKVKTIKQWIEDAIALTPKEKEKALKYATQYELPNGVQTRLIDTQAKSFRDAIYGSFVLAETEEGHYYWQCVVELEEKAMDRLYDYSAE